MTARLTLDATSERIGAERRSTSLVVVSSAVKSDGGVLVVFRPLAIGDLHRCRPR